MPGGPQKCPIRIKTNADAQRRQVVLASATLVEEVSAVLSEPNQLTDAGFLALCLTIQDGPVDPVR